MLVSLNLGNTSDKRNEGWRRHNPKMVLKSSDIRTTIREIENMEVGEMF